jgi:hypothetical protein
MEKKSNNLNKSFNCCSGNGSLNQLKNVSSIKASAKRAAAMLISLPRALNTLKAIVN